MWMMMRRRMMMMVMVMRIMMEMIVMMMVVMMSYAYGLHAFFLSAPPPRSVHLCEPCCRREHELLNVEASLLATTLPSSTSSSSATPLIHLEELQTAGSWHFEGTRKYALRQKQEYTFMCDNLAQVNVSLMDSLQTLPLEAGTHTCVCVCVLCCTTVSESQ
jgi:hypothetical protein